MADRGIIPALIGLFCSIEGELEIFPAVRKKLPLVIVVFVSGVIAFNCNK